MQISKLMTAAGAALLFVSCSSAPKKPVEEYAVHNASTTQMTTGNSQLNSGNYADALTSFTEALRLATLADDTSLRVTAKIAQAYALQGMNKTEEADAVRQDALAEAEVSGDDALVSAASIAVARGLAMEGGNPQKVKQLVADHLKGAQSNPTVAASGYMAVALADKELENYADAESSLQKAAAVYNKRNYLAEAAYTWYLIGSVRSKADDYKTALDALDTALSFARRAECSAEIALIWKGIAIVQDKSGNADAAAAAQKRAAEITQAAVK